MAATAIDTTAIAAIVIGLGGSVAAMVYPVKYPNAPKWAVDLSWWGGLFLVLAGVLYLLVEHIDDLGHATVAAFGWLFGHLVALQRLPGFWLVVMFACGLAMGVWFVPLAINRIKEGLIGGPIVETWLTPVEAIQTFVSPDLLLEDKRASERVEMLTKKIAGLKTRKHKADAMGDVTIQLSDARFVAKSQHVAVMESLRAQLGSGQLVAKGFKNNKGKIKNSESYIDHVFWKIITEGTDTKKLYGCGRPVDIDSFIAGHDRVWHHMV